MTEQLSAPQVAAALDRASGALIDARDRLNAADAQFGDGDTGTMLKRAAQAVMGVTESADYTTPAGLLRKSGQAIARDTGSSLGTLIAIGLNGAAQSLGDRATVSPQDLSDALAGATAQMRAAGGARPGDKTVVDLLDALVLPLTNGETGAQLASEARRTLDDYRDRPCRIGRARLYPEKSPGQDDPGMLAACIATCTICGTAFED